MSSSSQIVPPSSNRVRIIVASSVMLTFITWVRAAAIVLNDLGSSAYYAGSISEQAIGKAAPWLVLGVMFFSFAVRAVYVESCSMFVRGGVYRVVKEALGGTLAKLSVSALMFDYILTGPISGVSAGQYIAGLVNEALVAADAHGWVPRALHALFNGAPQLPVNSTSVVVAVAVTVYFWWQNTKGIEESSEKAMRVMEITTVMVVILLAWAGLTVARGHFSLPPLPIEKNLSFNESSLGFLKNHPDLPHLFGIFGVLMAFGHSILAMSGEESLAQVYREIGSPKLKNLKKTALAIAVYSTVFTGISSLLAVMLIPDAVRMSPEVKDNLLGAMVMYFVGPQILKLLFRAFVVFVGFLMLAGAINTAIVGSNGVLNRVSEDGVLTDWFRRPHKRFGTSYRIINLIVGLQLFTILASHGDVYVLGEAYAFGVIWSFVFKAVSMFVLRFTYKGQRDWKVPLNPKIFGIEIPVGLGCISLALISTALVNLFTKSVATVSGLIFSAIFFVIFEVSEQINKRKFAAARREMQEHFQLRPADTITSDKVGIRPGCVLVTVRDYNTLAQLRWALEHTSPDHDVVVLAARLTGPGSAMFDLAMEQVFGDYEQMLFTKAVAVAESVGRRISLMVVPARDVWSAVVQTALQLDAAAIVAGLSSKMTPQEQAFNLGRAWEAMPEPKKQLLFQVVMPDMTTVDFRIGPHTPAFRGDDVQLVHRLWLDITRKSGYENVHHSDIVSLALTRFARDYAGRDREDILRLLTGDHRRSSLLGGPTKPPVEPPSGKKDDDKSPPTPPIVAG